MEIKRIKFSPVTRIESPKFRWNKVYGIIYLDKNLLIFKLEQKFESFKIFANHF